MSLSIVYLFSISFNKYNLTGNAGSPGLQGQYYYERFDKTMARLISSTTRAMVV